MIKRVLAVAALAMVLVGCATVPSEAIRVGSYNIRFSSGDKGTPNDWDCRKADLVGQPRVRPRWWGCRGQPRVRPRWWDCSGGVGAAVL